MKAPFHCLLLDQMPIFEQLIIEETLLRMDNRNWCIVNRGSPPAIVMGISGKKEELVNLEKLSTSPIPLIKRFSGGGTVVVDPNTLFVTFISNRATHPFPAYPEPIMRWSESIYVEAFEHPHFHLKENDFVIDEKKCGGNAQYIRKDRWLHHTSFLWDYASENMQYLLYPKRTPSYREGRSHDDFLCRLKDHFPNTKGVIEKLWKALDSRYGIEMSDLKNLPSSTLSVEERRSTLHSIN